MAIVQQTDYMQTKEDGAVDIERIIAECNGCSPTLWYCFILMVRKNRKIIMFVC
ncbi:hypothetical protein [Bacillus smithii]|uniref:hypothetical protein n=1 Tax=Bacillus smithii TaxID=1479 RepID=UPI0022E849B3|nr:hypothetical protein [Bacillus smithii]